MAHKAENIPYLDLYMSTSDLIHRDLGCLEIPQNIMLSGTDEQEIVSILFSRMTHMDGTGWEISPIKFKALLLQ